MLTPQALIARDDIDLIVIATPNDMHYPLARMALLARRNVVVDKPFALDAIEAADLVETAEQNDCLLSVFHNRRWDSDYLTIQATLREGLVGRPVEFVSHFDRYRPQVRNRWREGDGPGAGLWMDLGPHLVDQAVHLFDVPSAIAMDRAPPRTDALADEWPAQIASSLWGRDERVAELWQSDGERTASTKRPIENGAYPTYYMALRDALLGMGSCPVTASDALAVQRSLDAGHRSAIERSEIAFH